jgi:two-component system phosphate regulon response regulator OmpR
MERLSSRIAILDDDAQLRHLLRRYLSEKGYEVDAAGTVPEFERLLERRGYALIILDLMLPGESGLSFCRRLRARGEQVPIIMLTAKGDETDRVIGLEIGADDYLAKPFSPRELVARIQAVLRRGPKAPIPGAPRTDGAIVSFGPFRLDTRSRKLEKGGERIALTTGEYAVLEALVLHPRQPLSRERLTELARGRAHLPNDRSMDIQISRLRRILEDDPARPERLQTVWGYGYVFVPDDPSAGGTEERDENPS